MHPRRFLVLSLAFVVTSGCGSRNPVVEEGRAQLGTGLFAPASSLDVGSWPSAVAIADVDGDGANEVLMTTDYYFDEANDYKLMVFRPNASGGMQEIARYSVGRGADSMAVGDVNGDGRTDVVVANSNSESIGIFYQNAGGTLDPMVAIATTSSLRVRVADLNGDGRQDIVGIHWGTDIVDLFLQDEQGQLTGRATYHVSHGGYDDLEVGDVNHDGRTDIVVMSGQAYAIPSFGVLLQTAQGTFAGPTYYSVGTNILTHGVAIGDVDGDGRQDVIVSYGGNKPSSMIGVFKQNLAGGLDPVRSLSSYDIPQSVVAADVDHNGATDVLVLHGGWNAMGVYSQSTAGTLDAEVRYSIPYASSYSPDGLAVGDFNGDGLLDVAIADYNYGLVTLQHLPMAADTTPPTVAVGEPAGRVSQVGVPLQITWTASDNVGVAGFEVLYSSDGGATFSGIADCAGLGPAIRACTWVSPGPASPTARIRVVAQDASGNAAFADASFVLQSPPDTTPPTVAVGVPAGSIAYTSLPLSIAWTASDDVALGSFDVVYSIDGGTTTTPVAECTGLGADLRSCSWSTPGPASASALVRVFARDAAGNTAFVDVPFELRQPELAVTTAPQWESGTEQQITWTHNLPAGDSMMVELSRNGGSSWEALAPSAPNTGSVAISATGPATLDGRVRVTWLASPSVQATTTVVIVPANTPPTVNAGLDQTVTLPAAITLSGLTADDGLPNPPGAVTTTWSMVEGPGTVSFADAAALSTTASFSTAGTYTLRLVANDGALSVSDDVGVTVIAAPVNTPPVTNAGSDQAITLPAAADLIGTVSDDGLPNPPGTTTVAWSVTSGPGTVTFGNPEALSTTAAFSAAGTYTLRLSASDGALLSSDDVVITVSAAPVNQAPIVNAGADQTITLPTTAQLAGAASDDGLPNPPARLTTTWSKVSGAGTVTFANASALSTTATFSTAGSYTLRLTATDGALSAFDDVIVKVNAAPGPCAGLCSNPTIFPINGSYQSGNLGTGAVCYQTTSTIHGGNCGNLVGSRKLSVNGTIESCNGRTWATIPASRNGGYCIQTTTGNHPWAYFTAW